MSCNRGVASPNTHTKLRLFADSAGYCQNPQCTLPLFDEVNGDEFHLAEMAHIVAASDDGPRANTALTPAERGAYQNLILLCPTCHTRIDKAPKAFPDAIVRMWKQRHRERIAALFGAVPYGSRADARKAIVTALMENRTIFELYGPETESRFNPESDLPIQWRRKVATRIIPNNRRILGIVDSNHALLTAAERELIEVFRQHVDDLEARHLGDRRGYGGTRFPGEMNRLFEGNHE